MFNRLLFYPFLALTLASSSLAHAEVSGSAIAAFKQLDDVLQNNPLDFDTSFDASSDGNELYRGKGHFILRQPNALKADITLDKSTYTVISDGTVLTIYNQQQKKYSQTEAQPSLSAAFGFFTGELGIDSQVLNFMGIVHEVVAGELDATVKAAGNETIEGKSCDAYTISGPSGDDTWRVWLEKGDKPLLCKLVYHNVDGPAQTNVFHWNPTPETTPATFTFSPPPGVTKVDVGELNMAAP